MSHTVQEIDETAAPTPGAGALSAETIAIVKATAPLLATRGEELTRHFYERMFRGNPEVLPFFNPGNQHSGAQQRALAGAICAYASSIDKLELLGDAVELIAQKHASLQVLPEHYPIVGEHLLGSIREVLGEAATGEVVAAWGEAYQFLAAILIRREGEIYQGHAIENDGWQGFRRFKVVRKEAESAVITSFYLEPEEPLHGCPCAMDGGEGGKGGIKFKPGQYITIRLPHPTSGSTMRQYSISSVPWDRLLRVSVKREEEGFASRFLHHEVHEGGFLEVGPPCGDFFYSPASNDERGECPLVLLSAGVGITPLLSILRAALVAEPKRKIIFIHGALNGRTHGFVDDLAKLAANHPQLRVHYRYSEALPGDHKMGIYHDEGFIDLPLLKKLVPGPACDFYFCGPTPFMKAVYANLKEWGVEPRRKHFEFFGPREELVGNVESEAIAL